MSSILGSATNWLVKKGLQTAFGGGSSGGGGSASLNQKLAADARENTQRLSSIEGRQVMQEYGNKKRDIESQGKQAATPPPDAKRNQKSNMGIQLINKAKQLEVSDPIMSQLIVSQGIKSGNITDDQVASINSSFPSKQLDTGTRVRKTSRGSFLTTTRI